MHSFANLLVVIRGTYACYLWQWNQSMNTTEDIFSGTTHVIRFIAKCKNNLV